MGVYFVLGMTFFNAFWYKDNGCFGCLPCSMTDDSVCWGDWQLLGNWQDTCPCSLKDEVLWEEAEFAFLDDLSDCNITLYTSDIFDYDGDNSVLDSCMYYESGLFMNLGIPMIAFTLLAMITGCWGFLKNLKAWLKIKYDRAENQVEVNYGSTKEISNDKNTENVY